jgi:Na+-driven multidrug efflux pump
VADANGTPGPPRRGWRDRDHTRGSLLTSLLTLALPMLASSLLLVAFQLIDLTFLSRLGEAPMAAVIIVNQTLRQLVMLLVMGGSVASQALVARAVGEGRLDRAEHVAGQVVVLAGVFALLVALAGVFFAGALFSLPGPDPSFAVYGVPYLRLVYLLSFGMVGTQFFAAILGGAGDTTTPFLVMAVQTGIAVFAEWVLIFGHLGAPALGVRGVALGIATGQIVAMAIGLAVLFRGSSRVHIRRRHLVPDPVVMGRILRLSWPAAVQMGTAVAMTFAYLRAIRVALLVHGSVMWCFAAAVFLLRTQIMDLFSDDPEVIAIGAEYLVYLAGALVLWAFYFVFLRALQGAGDMLVPMLISLSTTFLVSIPLAFLLSLQLGLGRKGIWIAFLTSSAVGTVAIGLRLASGRWARRVAHFRGEPSAK